MRAQAGRFLTRRVENPDQIGQAADAARWRVGRSKANRGRKTGNLPVDGRLERCAIIALMRHLKNPDERPKTPAIEPHPAPPIAAVRDDTRQLIASSIADNTRLAYAAALNRPGRRGSGRPPDRFHDCRSHRRVARPPGPRPPRSRW